MYRNQNGVCATCSVVPIEGRKLVVDHDHRTGKVRGLLCQPCNISLGAAKDKPDVLRSLADYLVRSATIEEDDKMIQFRSAS